MTWAYGKAILFGEHAVVYGFPALAGALDRTIEASFSPESGGLRLRVPAWSDGRESTGLDIDCAGEHVVAQAVRAVLGAAREHIDSGGSSLDLQGVIHVRAEVPAAAGLGSSAALCVALARLFFERARVAPALEVVERVAGAGERCFHRDPSGVDVALAARGGLGMFVRGRGLEPVRAEAVDLAVGLSGEPRRTSDMVARVAAQRADNPQLTDRRLAALGRAAELGKEALERSDLAALGALMTQAQSTLTELGVSTPALDRLVAEALAAGALGAKLTGAGGGGAVIAATADSEAARAVVQAFQRAGFSGFACRVGGRQRGAS